MQSARHGARSCRLTALPLGLGLIAGLASLWRFASEVTLRPERYHLLLMPEYGFVRTELGTFFLEPFALQPWTARLRMETSFGGTSCVTQKAPFN